MRRRDYEPTWLEALEVSLTVVITVMLLIIF